MRKLCCLVAFTLTVICLNAYSDSPFAGRWYKIELIIFSHVNTQSVDEEQWPLIQSTNFSATRMIQLKASDNNSPYNSSNHQLLPPTFWSMKHAQANLMQNPSYHILLHAAWAQQVTGDAKPIHIFGGNVYNSSGNLVTQADGQNNLENFNDRQIWQINGSLSISVQKYFDVYFNLLFASPTSQLIKLSQTKYFNNVSNNLFYFRLMQNRRMRSDEINYIDHPLYGVLIKITPIKRS